MQDHEHPQVTQRSRYRYQFTAKHHGAGAKGDARWLPEISEDEEFSVFDTADLNNLSDEEKGLYGILRDPQGRLRELGTWYQQMAFFPSPNEGGVWHGYPLWPTSEETPPHRRGAKYKPAREVFDKMVAASLITSTQRIRLMRGDHAGE